MAKERLREVEQSAQKNTTTMKSSDARDDPRKVPSEMVAVAAYYKAEKRGFSPGRELQDWLEAEKEIQDRGAAH